MTPKYRIEGRAEGFVDRYLARLDHAGFEYTVVETDVIACEAEPPVWRPVTVTPIE